MPHTRSGMYWEQRGEGEDTIVVLPGFGASMSLLDDLVGSLVGSPPARRVVVLDLPGHGGSTAAPADGELRALAETVHDAIAETEVETYHLLGYSLGAAIALRIALDHPEDLRSLIGLAPWNAGGTTPSDEVMAGFDRSYGDVDMLRQGVSAISVDPAQTAGLVDSMLGVTEQMWHGWLGGGALTSQADELPAVRVPTSYVVGGQDAVIDPARQIDDARHIPGSRVVLLNDLGHLCGIEEPDRVAREVSTFLDTVRG